MDEDFPIVDLDQEQLPIVDLEKMGKPRPAPPRPKPKPKKNPRQPVKPQLQEFKQPPLKLRSIGEQIQRSKFRFDPSPFQETPEQYMLRSADPTQIAPKERLRQAEFLATKARRPLVSIRPETKSEIEQSQALEWMESLTPGQTALYNIYQKGLGAIGDVSLAGVRGFAEVTGLGPEWVGRQIEGLKKDRDISRPPVESSLTASGKLSGQAQALGHLGRIGGSVLPLVALGRGGAQAGIPMTLTSGGVGALTGIGSTAEEIDRYAMTKDRRDIALVMGGLSGATEAFGIERVLDKFGLGAPFRKAVLGVAAEGGQGGVQRFLDNINAIYVGGWDAERGIMDQVALSTLEETIGAAMIMGTSSIAAARQRAKLGITDEDVDTFAKLSDRIQAKRKAAKIPPPPGYQPPMPPNRMGPMWDMILMSNEPKRPFTDKDRKRHFDLKEIIEAHNAGETWVKATVQWMGGIDKVKAEYEALEARRIDNIEGKSFEEEMQDITDTLDKDPNLKQPELTPGGRRRIPGRFFSDEKIDAMPEREYNLRHEQVESGERRRVAKQEMIKFMIDQPESQFLDWRGTYDWLGASDTIDMTPTKDLESIFPDNEQWAQLVGEYRYAEESLKYAQQAVDEIEEEARIVRQREPQRQPAEEISEEEYARREKEELEALGVKPNQQELLGELKKALRYYEMGDDLGNNFFYPRPVSEGGGSYTRYDMIKIKERIEQLEQSGVKSGPRSEADKRMDSVLAQLHQMSKASDYSHYPHLIEMLQEAYYRGKDYVQKSYRYNKISQENPGFDELVDEYIRLKDEHIEQQKSEFDKETQQRYKVDVTPDMVDKRTAQEKLQEEEADKVLGPDGVKLVERMGIVRTTPGGREVYGTWRFTDEEVDDMSQTEYEYWQELTELLRLRLETLQKLWPHFQKIGYTKFGMLDHIKGSETRPDVAKSMLIRGIKDPEAVRLAETYAYIAARLPMLSEEETERLGTLSDAEANRLFDIMAEEDRKRRPPPPRLPEEKIDDLKHDLGISRREMFAVAGQYGFTRREFDDFLVQAENTADPAGTIKDRFPGDPTIAEWAERWGKIIMILQNQPPAKTNFEKEEEKFLAPRKKQPGDTDYGIMYKPTGIEEWKETKKKAIEEEKKKEDPDAWADDIDPDLPLMADEALYSPIDSPTSDVASDEFAFDVMPALRAGQAPYLRAPRWFMKSLRRKPTTRGVNFPIQHYGTIRTWIINTAPSIKHATAGLDALKDLMEQTQAEGLDSLAIFSNDTPEIMARGVIEHEVGHTATRQFSPNMDWVLNHPFIDNTLFSRETLAAGTQPTGMSIKEDLFRDLDNDSAKLAYASEIISYYINDRLDRLGLTKEEGRQFFKDYLNHIRSIYGSKAVDGYRNIVRVRQDVVEAINESEQEWNNWEAVVGPILPQIYQDTRMVVPADVYEANTGRAKKNVFQKMLDKFVKKNREILTEEPPAPTVPPDEPTGTPPPKAPPPRDLRVEGPLGPLRKEHVTPEYTKLITRTFTKMLEQGGIEVDPLAGAPFHQVAKALREGKLGDVDIETILYEEGVPWEQFATEMEETASDSGKVLQAYSEIARFWNEILDEYEGLDIEGFEVKPGKDKKGKKGKTITGPSVDQGKALLRIVPIQFRVKRILRHVNSTALGKNLWQRMGNTAQKAMLTQFSTFTVNTATTMGQLPFRTLIGGMGAWMYRRAEGGSLQEANRDMKEAMKASMEVAVALNPRQLLQLARGQKSSTEYSEYVHIVHELEKYFDVHRKLFALGSGVETLKKGARELSIAQALAKRIPLNNPLREDILKNIDTYEKRLDYNTSKLGKVLNAPEAVYDFLLHPMQWAEYFLRRPMFVGQLNLELSRIGLNLRQLMSTNSLDTIPTDVMERAVNKALEFTYAYMPGTKTGTDYVVERQVEKAAAGIITWLNKHGGPIGAIFGEPFAKAMFNGAKFVYEWSPIGGILPYARIGGNLTRKENIRDFNQARAAAGPNAQMSLKGIGMYTDPITGAVKLKNPTTQQDFDRLAKAMLGTMMYAVVGSLRMWLGGEEWWQFDLGEKDEKGRIVYTDIRRYKPLSTMFQMYDVVERIATGRVGEVDLHRAMIEIMTGIRLYENQMGSNIISSMIDYFRDEPESSWRTNVMRGEEEIGKAIAIYFTPLLNVRDLFAQFIEAENVKKDVRGETILGPVMDRIPFLRQRLPDLTSPTEPSPIKLSLNPGLTQTIGFGYKEVPAENFAGREWARMGLYNKSFIQRLPDPVANREQNKIFQEIIGEVGQVLEQDPTYLTMDDTNKAFVWEAIIGGDEGVAATAREIGWAHSPIESAKREIRRSVPGKFQRKATGLEKELENLK